VRPLSSHFACGALCPAAVSGAAEVKVVCAEWMGFSKRRDVDGDPRPYVKGLRAFAAARPVALFPEKQESVCLFPYSLRAML
jgi:hypothetical protein